MLHRKTGWRKRSQATSYRDLPLEVGHWILTCYFAAAHAVPHTLFLALGGTYAKIHHDLDWPAAKKACNNLGMELALLTNAEIFNDVHTKTNIGYSYWIGGSDRFNGGSEGNWFWPNGRKFWPSSAGSYANWASGEPNGGSNENCLQAFPSGQWNDQPCATKWPVLCGPQGE